MDECLANKPDLEGQTLDDSMDTRHLEQADSQRRDEEQRLPGASAARNEEHLFSGFRISVWNSEKVIQTNSLVD